MNQDINSKVEKKNLIGENLPGLVQQLADDLNINDGIPAKQVSDEEDAKKKKNKPCRLRKTITKTNFVHQRLTPNESVQPEKLEMIESLKSLLIKLANLNDVSYKNHQSDKTDKKKFQRRIVCGLHEIEKYLTTESLYLIIFARNYLVEVEPMNHVTTEELLEVKRIPSGVRMIQTRQNLIEASKIDLPFYFRTICREAELHKVPYIFELSRAKLGQLCNKKRPLTVIGVINISGAEAQFKEFVSKYIRPYN